MKVTQDNGFKPVTIILEKEFELTALKAVLGGISVKNVEEIADISNEHARQFESLYFKLDNL